MASHRGDCTEGAEDEGDTQAGEAEDGTKASWLKVMGAEHKKKT